MSIFKAYDNSHSNCKSLLGVQIIMPSIDELSFIDVENGIVEGGILEVVSLIVHAQSYYIMSSLVVVGIGCGVIEGFEVLD